MSLPTARTAEEASVYIREDASTAPACLADSLHCNKTCECNCSSLGTVLNNLNELNLCSTVSIHVEYSHNISSVNVKLTKNMNVSISGTGNPTLTCVNGANVSIVSSKSVSVIFEFRDRRRFVFSGLD